MEQTVAKRGHWRSQALMVLVSAAGPILALLIGFGVYFSWWALHCH